MSGSVMLVLCVSPPIDCCCSFLSLPFFAVEPNRSKSSLVSSALIRAAECRARREICSGTGASPAARLWRHRTAAAGEGRRSCSTCTTSRPSTTTSTGSASASSTPESKFMAWSTDLEHTSSQQVECLRWNRKVALALSTEDDVCKNLTRKSIPGWVNRLARVGSFFNCLLPESIRVSAVTNVPTHPAFSDDDMDSVSSTVTGGSDMEELDQHLLPSTNDVHSVDVPKKLEDLL